MWIINNQNLQKTFSSVPFVNVKKYKNVTEGYFQQEQVQNIFTAEALGISVRGYPQTNGWIFIFISDVGYFIDFWHFFTVQPTLITLVWYILTVRTKRQLNLASARDKIRQNWKSHWVRLLNLASARDKIRWNWKSHWVRLLNLASARDKIRRNWKSHWVRLLVK